LEFTANITPGDEGQGFDKIAHALDDWAREQDDYEDDDSDASAAEALSEALCTCHGGWPRSDTARDALESLRRDGYFRAAFDAGFTVFEVRYIA
jgi:hypothetical protein